MSTPLDPISLGLPHRAPFIFVDRVLELDPGQSALCTKVFPESEAFFQGHFPGNPLVPGVILTEALAQSAGIAAAQPTGFLLTAIKGMKFFGAVRPNEEIALRAKKMMAVGGLWQFEVSAEVGGQKMAEGVVVLSATAG